MSPGEIEDITKIIYRHAPKFNCTPEQLLQTVLTYAHPPDHIDVLKHIGLDKESSSYQYLALLVLRNFSESSLLGYWEDVLISTEMGDHLREAAVYAIGDIGDPESKDLLCKLHRDADNGRTFPKTLGETALIALAGIRDDSAGRYILDIVDGLDTKKPKYYGAITRIVFGLRFYSTNNTLLVLDRVAEIILNIDSQALGVTNVKETIKETFSQLDQSIKNDIQESYPNLSSIAGDNKPKKGCFIATAAIGDPNDRSVVLLRKYRDACLLSSEVGIQFVRYYYRYSPAVAKWIGQKTYRRNTVRVLVIRPLIWFARIMLWTKSSS